MSSPGRKSTGGRSSPTPATASRGRATRNTPKRARSRSLTELDRMNIRAERQKQLEAQQLKKKQREKSPMRRPNKRESSPMPTKRVSSPMPTRKRECSPMPPRKTESLPTSTTTTRKRQLSPMRANTTGGTTTTTTTSTGLNLNLNLSSLLSGMGNSDNAKFEFACRRCIPSEFVLIASQDDNNQAQEDFFAMEHFDLKKHVSKFVYKANAGSVATTALLQIMYENPQRMVAGGGSKPINVLELSRELKSRAKQCTKLDLRPTISSSRPLGPPRLGQEDGDEQYAPFYIVPPANIGGVRRALLIGVITGQGADLKGPPNDVANIQQFLVNHCGFKRDNITVLQDFYPGAASLKPTKTNILNGFTKLVRASKPGDVNFIQFTGHGGRMGNQLYICPSDYKKAGQVSDEMILKDLIKAMPKDVYTTMLVDCCYSGTVGDLPYVLQHNRTKQQIDLYYDLDMRREMIAKEKQFGDEYREYKRQRAEKRIENRINLTEVAQAMATAATDVVVGTGKLGYDVVVGTGTAAAEAVGNSAARISAAANLAAQAASATAATAGMGLRRAMTIDTNAENNTPPKQRSSDGGVGRMRGRSPMGGGASRSGTRATPRRARSRSLTEIDRMQIAQERLKMKNNSTTNDTTNSDQKTNTTTAPFGRSWTKGSLSSSTTTSSVDDDAATGGRISRQDRKRIASKSPIRSSGGVGATNLRVSRRNRNSGTSPTRNKSGGSSGDENNSGGMVSSLLRVGTAAGDALKRSTTSSQMRTSTGKAARAEKAARKEAIERSKREAMEARQMLNGGGDEATSNETTTTNPQSRASTGNMFSRSTTNPVNKKKGFFGGFQTTSTEDDDEPPKRSSSPVPLSFGRSMTTSSATANKKTGFFGGVGSKKSKEIEADRANGTAPRRNTVLLMKMAMEAEEAERKEALERSKRQAAEEREQARERASQSSSERSSRKSVLNLAMAFENSITNGMDMSESEQDNDPNFISGFRGTRRMTAINRMLEEDAEMEEAQQQERAASEPDFVPGFRGTRRMTAINRMLEEDAEMEAQQERASAAARLEGAAGNKGRSRMSVANLTIAFESSFSNNRDMEDTSNPDFIPGFRGTRRLTAIDRMLAEDAEMEAQERAAQERASQEASGAKIGQGRSRMSVANLAMAFESSFSSIGDRDMEDTSDPDFIPGFRGTRRMTAINRMLAEDAEMEAQDRSKQEGTVAAARPGKGRSRASVANLAMAFEAKALGMDMSDSSHGGRDGEDKGEPAFIPGFRGTRRMTAINRALAEDAEMETLASMGMDLSEHTVSDRGEERNLEAATEASSRRKSSVRFSLSGDDESGVSDDIISSFGASTHSLRPSGRFSAVLDDLEEKEEEDDSSDSSEESVLSEDNNDPDFVPGFRGERRLTAIDRMLEEDAEMEAQERAAQEAAATEETGKGQSRPSVTNMAMDFETSFSSIGEQDVEDKTEPDFIPGFRGTRRMTAINRMLAEDAEMEAQEKTEEEADFIPGFRGTRRMTAINRMLAEDAEMEAQDRAENHGLDMLESSAAEREVEDKVEPAFIPGIRGARRMTAINRMLAEDEEKEAQERTSKEKATPKVAMKKTSKPRIVAVKTTPSDVEEKTNMKKKTESPGPASSLTAAEQIKARIAAKKKAKAMETGKPKVAEAPKVVKVSPSGSPARSRKSVINIAMAFEARKADSDDVHHDGETVETTHTEDTTVSADDRSCHTYDEEQQTTTDQNNTEVPPVSSIKRRMTAINRALAEDAQEEARKEAMERSRREAAEARAAARKARGTGTNKQGSEYSTQKPAQRRNTAINLALAIEAEEKSRKEAQERSRREAAEARAAARRARQQQQQRVL